MSWPVSTIDDLKNRLNNDNQLPLHKAEAKVFSQNGEDGIILEIFKRIGSPTKGKFLEFGVQDGTETCSRLLLEAFSWSGSYIEADSNDFESLRLSYKSNKKLLPIKNFVTADNINDIIKDNKIKDLDLIVIDIDSVDYQIFEAINAIPKLFVVEYNASLPFDKSLVCDNPVWDYSANYGASILALKKIAAKKGYSLIHTDLCGVNAFFIKDEYLDLFPEANNPKIRKPNYHLKKMFHPGLDFSNFKEY